MPSSFSKLYQSAKSKLKSQRKSDCGIANSSSSESTSSKSVRFSSRSNFTIYDTYSNEEYDRRSSISTDRQHEGDSLHHNNASILGSESQEDDEDAIQFSEEVMRNTKVNKRRGHYSIAVLVNYRSNI